MNNRDELCRRLYEELESQFPNLDIIPSNYGGGCKKTPYHIHDDGKHSKGDYTFFNGEKYGYTVKSYSEGEAVSIIDFYKEKTGKDYKELCSLVGLQSSKESEEWSRKSDLRNWINGRLSEELYKDTPGAKKHLEYLYGRGWTDDDIKKVGLGYMTKQFKENIAKSDKLKEIAPEFHTAIGETHTLTIPYKNGTTFVGWNCRNINPTEGEPKYKATKGIEKYGLSGLRRGFDNCIVVEGDLDALHPQTKGKLNVFATTGGGVTERHAQDLNAKGYKYVTLLFDNDERGREFVGKSIENLEKVNIKVFISSLPDGYKDTDEYLKTNSVEDWGKVVDRNAKTSTLYKFDKYLDSLETAENDVITRSRIITTFRDMILKTPLEDRQLLRDEINSLNFNCGIDKKDLQEYFNKAISTLNETKTLELIKNSTDEVSRLVGDGRTSEAIELLSDTLKRASYNTNGDYLSQVFRPYTSIGEIYKEIGNVSEGLPTGIVFGKRENENHLTIKEGLSFVCGAQGHRKTTFLLNMAINEATRNIETQKVNGGGLKKVLVISYEMSRDRILSNLTNIYVNTSTLNGYEMDSPYNTITGIIRGKYDPRYYTKENDEKGLYDRIKEKIHSFFEEYIYTEAIKTVYLDNNTVGTLLDAIKFYRENTKGEVSLICVDYAQELTSENYSRQRTEEVKEIVNRVKYYANDERLPILMGAQFNREVITPMDVIPSKIGEAGDLERIAVDCVGLYYLRKLETGKYKEFEKMGVLDNYKTVKDIVTNEQPIRGYLYVKLMKSRYGDYPLDLILQIDDKTGKITVNDENRIKVEPRDGELNLQDEKPFEGTTGETAPF